MPGNLFDIFGVDADLEDQAVPDPTEVPLSRLDQTLQDLADNAVLMRRVMESIPPNMAPNLNRIYINKLAEYVKKHGKFAFLCARCWKPIHDPRKQHHDLQGGFVYGTDCWETISLKQRALTQHHDHTGAHYANPEELQTFHCHTSGRDFRAVPSNVVHCGSSPRMCAVCPGTLVKNKNRLCQFERAMYERRKRPP